MAAANAGDTADHRPVVLVTGGSGLLGSRLIDRLRRDHEVVSLDLQGDPHSPPDVEFICTDVTSDESVARAVQRVESRFGSSIASVVHLAAYYDFSGADSPMYDEITVKGSERLLRAVRELDVEQFVFSSTMLVHEPTDPGAEIAEHDPVDPGWPYPESKVRAEQTLAAADSVPLVFVRLAGAYDEMGHSPPITNQIKRIHSKSLTSRFYPGELERGQAFVHIDDAIDALMAIVERRHELSERETLLIGEPKTFGYGELQELIAAELHGTPWRTWRIPKPLAVVGAWLQEHKPFGEKPFIRSWMVGQADDHYDLDITKATSTVGWQPNHQLDAVIPTMVQRLKKDPRGWYEENGLTPPRRAR